MSLDEVIEKINRWNQKGVKLLEEKKYHRAIFYHWWASIKSRIEDIPFDFYFVSTAKKAHAMRFAGRKTEEIVETLENALNHPLLAYEKRRTGIALIHEELALAYRYNAASLDIDDRLVELKKALKESWTSIGCYKIAFSNKRRALENNELYRDEIFKEGELLDMYARSLGIGAAINLDMTRYYRELAEAKDFEEAIGYLIKARESLVEAEKFIRKELKLREVNFKNEKPPNLANAHAAFGAVGVVYLDILKTSGKKGINITIGESSSDGLILTSSDNKNYVYSISRLNLEKARKIGKGAQPFVYDLWLAKLEMIYHPENRQGIGKHFGSVLNAQKDKTTRWDQNVSNFYKKDLTEIAEYLGLKTNIMKEFRI